MNKKIVLIYGFISILILLPIWLYLMYFLLKNSPADRLVWFLFWLYVPLSIITGVLAAIMKGADSE